MGKLKRATRRGRSIHSASPSRFLIVIVAHVSFGCLIAHRSIRYLCSLRRFVITELTPSSRPLKYLSERSSVRKA
jgi:hypothetical protein